MATKTGQRQLQTPVEIADWVSRNATGALLVAHEHVNDLIVRSFLSRVRRLEPGTQIREVAIRDIAALRENAAAASNEDVTDAISRAKRLFATAQEKRASDIHIYIYRGFASIKLRIHGAMTDYQGADRREAMALCRSIYGSMSDVADTNLQPQKRQDARIAGKGFLPAGVHGIRVATAPTDQGFMMVMRLLYEDVNEGIHKGDVLINLGYTPRQAKAFGLMAARPHGINFISGITGSGKSTTLKYELESIIKRRPDLHVLTVEDPPEYPIENANQIPVKNAEGSESRAEAFIDTLRGAMRLDPDVMMVGEVRDEPTARVALGAAMTGHQVWSTIHTDDAWMIITRLLGMGLELEEIADAAVLTGLISQRLVRTLCPHCRIPLAKADMDTELRARIGHAIPDTNGVCVKNTAGCDQCGDGVSGRSVVAEVLVPTDALFDIVRREGVSAARKYWHETLGGMSILDHAISKVAEGVVDPADAEAIVGPLTLKGMLDETPESPPQPQAQELTYAQA
jgi:type II secretory ATPase GspE/PulE/Tfp pilus assembly ATPase PilB-like protein